MSGTVHLRPGHVQPVWTGHPWVFAQAIARIDGDPHEGDEVRVLDPRGNFLGRGFYSPKSAIPVRILSRDASDALTGEFFAHRLRDAATWRRSLLGLPGADTDGFRLVHAEGDGLPGLIVDQYADVLAVQFLTIGMKRRAPEILEALVAATGAASIVEVASARHQKLEGFEVREGLVAGRPIERLTFRERNFEFDLPAPGATGAAGQKTGYYFDQRETRAVSEQLAAGRTVLDLYSYAGGFGLACARGGAKHVISVDSSALAIDCGVQAANRAGVSERVEWIRGDARRVMNQFDVDERRFDFVVLDPPKLASTARDLEEARGQYRKINAAAMRLVAPGGLLLSCSCSQAVTGGDFVRTLSISARDVRRDLTVLRWLGQPPDHPVPSAFPEGRYLKCVLARVH